MLLLSLGEKELFFAMSHLVAGERRSFLTFLCTYHLFLLFIICLYQQMHTHTHTHTHTYIYILNYITNAPTCFSGSAPFSGSYDIAFVTVIKL